MRSEILPCLILFTSAWFGVSCRQAEAPKPTHAENTTAVAVVADTAISAEAFKAELRRQFRTAPAGSLTSEQKLAALDALIRQEALYAQAKASGFDQTSEIQARIRGLIVSHFKEQRFKPDQQAVSEREIEAFYGGNGELFALPGAVRGAVIFLALSTTATVERKAEFQQHAEAILKEARSTTDEPAFARLVARYSEDQTTRYRGGDLGWLTAGQSGADPTLVEALFALKRPGGFAPLVKTPRGFYIVRLLESRAAGRKALAEVRETIRYQLSREKAAQAERDFYETMKAGLAISVNRDLIETISLPAPTNESPQLPGSTTAQLR